MKGTTCREQNASLAIMWLALRFGRIVANANVATTTYSYDANGNLIQAGGWSYMWDYLNRMLASGYNNSTTTYAYDPSGARVLQTSTTSTTYYPNKYYSFTSTKIGANTYATSTNYIWNGDTLLATIDQPMFNGTATGSPITRYIHPDHLGSTNVVTDASGTVAQLLDYYPYGATRVSSNTYPTNEKRQYIGQFADAQTSLNYLNARFYDSARGQFISQDPEFWGTQRLTDPQSLNAYSYAEDNPITREDPSGRAASISGILNSIAAILNSILNILNNVNTVTASGGSGGSSGSGSHSGGSGGMPSPTMVPSVPVPMRGTTWDPVSNQRIQTLDPRVRQPATDFINEVDDWTNVKLRINEAYRSSAQQNAYYAKGRDSQGNIVDKSKVVTYAQGGESYHNYGRAADVVIMTNGQPDWSKPITPDIASYGIKQGFEWGGNFPSTPIDKRDYPHFQMTFGQSVQELQAEASQ